MVCGDDHQGVDQRSGSNLNISCSYGLALPPEASLDFTGSESTGQVER